MTSPDLISFDPSTGAELWRGPAGDADAAVRAARAAFPAWATAPLDARLAIIARYRDLVRERAAPFARLIAQETGKPLWDAAAEVNSVATKIDISIEAYNARTGTRVAEIAAGRQAVRHKPHGVLAVLGPYNFPAHLPNGHIVPALIAGNTVVFKPSEHTPATAAHMADLWREAGLPPGVLGVVQGAANEGRAVASHPDIDGLLFTGSAATGHALARAFAETPPQDPRARNGRQQPAHRLGRARHRSRRRDRRAIGLSQQRPALHLRAPPDRPRRRSPRADRGR